MTLNLKRKLIYISENTDNIGNCKSYTSKLLIILLILNDKAMKALLKIIGG